MVTKKIFNRNITIGIIVALILIAIVGLTLFAIVDVPSRSSYSTYGVWSGEVNTIIYSIPVENIPQPGFSNLHSMVDTLRTVEMVELEEFFINLNPDDYTCRVIGNVKAICNGRVRSDRCFSHFQIFDVSGNVIKVKVQDREIFACVGVYNELSSSLPSELIETYGTTFDYTGKVIFELFVPECNVDTDCSTGQICTNQVCEDVVDPPKPNNLIFIIIAFIGGSIFLFFISRKKKNGKKS